MSVDAPNRYEVDPLEYVAERVISAVPPYVTNEMATLGLQTGSFLNDGELPEEWRRRFLRRMVALCRSGTDRARINAAFLLGNVSDASGLVHEALAELSADGTWAELRAEIDRHLDALPDAPEDGAERAVWFATRHLPSQYLLPGSSCEPMQTMMGPAEAEQRAEQGRALAERAREEEDRGQDLRAAGTWAEAARLVPDNRDARVNRALCFVRAGKYERALPLLDQLCEERPSDARCHSARGAALMGAGRCEEALAALDQALELDPGRPIAVLNRAQVLAALGRRQEVEGFLVAAVRGNGWRVPSDATDLAIDVLLPQAMQAVLGDRLDVAADLAGAACELPSEAADAWLLRAYAAWMRGYPDQAEEYLARVDEAALRLPAALMVRAELAYEMEDFRTAITCADLVLAQDPRSSAALWTRARASDGAGNMSDAVHYYQRYLAQRPDDGEIWNDLGVCFQHIGDGNQALASFKQAVEKNPNDAMHWANLALSALGVAGAQANISVIRGYLATAWRLQPESEATLWALGVFYCLTGHLAQAERVLVHLLRIAPEHERAHMLLAQCRGYLASEETSGRMSGERE
ncbi:tetratricopeptide repeat protein [Streptomyces sp. NPDC056921]|uniref:tetratricopeptide repeat protein n=1 Tax=Streptomyces sp. NPDC056921 TaxID=3345966 RepID=UPI003643A10B